MLPGARGASHREPDVDFIDRAFLRVRSSAFCYRFALFTRTLLAAGFIPTGMVKLMGLRFTLISTDHPIGAFFEAMYQTGLYWRFLGLTQVVAGVLILFPRAAHLRAAIFLGIITNIFVITLSMDFRGTPVVTGLMLLAVIYLCAWDFHRFRPLLTLSAFSEPVPAPRLDRWEAAGFLVFAFSLMNFFGITRSFIGHRFALVFIATGLAAGVATLGRFLWLWRRGAFAGMPRR
jgi:hypothetical protein